MERLFSNLTTLKHIEAGPVTIGERLIVQGIWYAEAKVESYEYIPTEARWVIYLDWGLHGKSKVYSTDEGSVWTRCVELN